MAVADFEQQCINTIRTLAIDAVQEANAGHPGMPMGAAAMAFVLWDRFLQHNPADPLWPDRDRFVLSAGHGSMLLYALLHLTGYDLPLSELKQFRQLGSRTPGHPEYGHTAGVETTTGPLGQGFANGVGMAIAEARLAAEFNRKDHEIVSHFTYGIVSDGDLMEGIASEAASLAGHLKLGKLIYLYDDNHISIEGSTGITFTEDRLKRFESYGWHVEYVEDGNNLDDITAKLATAHEHTHQPSLIAVRTQIGFGSPNKQNTASAHGEPLGPDEVSATKAALNWPNEPAFHIPEHVLEYFRTALETGETVQNNWQRRWRNYEKAYPALASEFRRRLQRKLPQNWENYLQEFDADAKGMATRASSGKALNAISDILPELFGGSADLAPSTKTLISSSGDFAAAAYHERNLRFGVREHAMAGICNGILLHGALRPYCATFLVFSDYMRPSIRLAALMQIPVIYVFTHDSIGLGEDGPTHQPIEHLAALRAIPNLTCIRPCDANETRLAWQLAMESTHSPVALILTRQGLPTLDRNLLASDEGTLKGGYVLRECNGSPDVILIATGSEIHPALEAATALAAKNLNARVISMPSWEIFDQQSEDYRDSVLDPKITKRVVIEAGIGQGWLKYAGNDGLLLTIEDRFGASGKLGDVMQAYGFSAETIAERVQEYCA